MPKATWNGAARPAHMRELPITAEMARAMHAMRAGALEKFRVGYARSCIGPFFKPGTLEGLWKRGLIDFTPIGKRAYLSREGLASLAALEAA